MSDRGFDSEVRELDGPLDFGDPLPLEEIAAIAAFRRRKDFERSEVCRRNARAIERLTTALVHRPSTRPHHPSRNPRLRVVSWNLQRGLHLDGIKAYLSAQEHLRHADLFLLNEVDIGMARSGNRDVAAELAEHLGFHLVFGSSYLCLDYGDARDGLSQEANRESLHGNAILSRYRIRRAENVSVAVSRDKFHSSEKRLGHKKALWAEIETPAGPLPVAAAHLDSYGSPGQRRNQLRDLLDRMEGRQLGERMLIGGDFNTSTYDVKSIPRLMWNLALKLARGGFPHAIHHYVHPYKVYEKAVFDELETRGFDYQRFNATGVGTTRYEVGSYESESTVSEVLPAFVVRILRWKLKPWNGVAPLKVDWFAGRGLNVCAAERSAGCLPPTVFERPTFNGQRLSDHDPILVDLEL